jgi:hypothetical protein
MTLLARGQARAEALMVDVGELRGPDVRVLNETTGQYAYTPGPLKYAGKGKAQTTDAIGNDADAGDRAVMVTRFEIHLPITAAAAAVDDVWTFTACVNDPQLVGRRFRVTSLMHKTHPTARRLSVEETQS